MKPIRRLRELFSPYEIAAAGQALSLLFAVAGIFFLISGRGPGGMIILLAVGAFCALAGYQIGRCANCGKPALKFYILNNERALGGLLFIRRAWPERECSGCRTPLDVI